MKPSKMVSIVEEVGDSLTVNDNVVEFAYESVPMVLIYDVRADRMRIMSPIVQVDDLEPGQLEAAMDANFHTALDVRYATGNGLVWSAFLHPLTDLSEDLLRSAVHQVAVARSTFGSDYTGGNLVFGGIRSADDDTVN